MVFARHLLWLLAVGLVIGCAGQPASPPTLPATAVHELLQVGVTSSASPLIPLIEAVYAQQNPQAQLLFVSANSDTLTTDLGSGQLDAILVHHIADGETRYFNPVALDGLVFITHPDNPVDALTSAEVQAIFNGRITNWQAVGGADAEIVLLSREPGAGLHTILRQQLMAEQRISPNALLEAGNEAMLTAVADNPAAIGYSSMGSASQVAGVKVLLVDGRSATPTTTADQTYPLTMPLYFLAASPAEPTGELRTFLAWLQSDEGQRIVEGVYGRVR
jgi:phosphate transport system substrate-binding protein